MDGTKLDLSGQQKTPTSVDPAATYKAVAEVDMEGKSNCIRIQTLSK